MRRRRTRLIKLRGKAAIITDEFKGIGLGCARAFAAHRCQVVIAARGREADTFAEQQPVDTGRAAMFVPADVTREADIEALIQTTWMGETPWPLDLRGTTKTPDGACRTQTSFLPGYAQLPRKWSTSSGTPRS